MTPRYIHLCLDGAVRRLTLETERSDFVAWNTARLAMLGFHNPDKFPDFRKAFPRRATPGQSAPKDGRTIMTQLAQMTAAMGGKVIRQ